MFMTIVPPAAVLGAEIAGVDLSRPIDGATFAAIERACITPARKVAFTRRLGEIESTSSASAGACPATHRACDQAA